MEKKYFGTDGIRGRVGEYPITPDFILKLGWAVGRTLAGKGKNSVLIGKDTRLSGYMLESALEAGLSAAGVNIQLLGPMPTPGIAHLTRAFRAQTGIVVSASHNPHHDNGIKFFSSQGRKLPDDLEHEIERQLDQPMTIADPSTLGKASRISDSRGRYIEFCKGTISSRIGFSGSKIVIDCANGATYHIAPHVFEELGAEVITIGGEPDGLNINHECGTTNLTALQQAVSEHSADFGIAFDGDGDRVMMVDHLGEIVDGDELVYIIAKSRLSGNKSPGTVIGTLMSNLGLEHALDGLGIGFKRAAVGDRYVMEMMDAHHCVLGGESSGHIICLDCTTTGDGIVSALQVMAEIWETGKTLHELKSGMQKYPQRLINVKITNQRNFESLPPIVDAKVEIERELQGTGRVLLRPSGTEPLVRVMVEGQDVKLVDKYANQLADVVREEMSARG